MKNLCHFVPSIGQDKTMTHNLNDIVPYHITSLHSTLSHIAQTSNGHQVRLCTSTVRQVLYICIVQHRTFKLWTWSSASIFHNGEGHLYLTSIDVEPRGCVSA